MFSKNFIIRIPLLYSVLWAVYEAASQLSTKPYSSLFSETGYPYPGDIPLLNRKVFRGSRVTIREHPYIVSVRRNFVHYLTGSLLTKNVVLSVAHPLYRVPIDELAVVSGENYSDRGTIVLTAVLLIIHKQFDPYTLKADLALIRFYEDIVVRSSTKTIELVSPTAAIFGTRAFVTGWGRCDFTGKELCLPRSSLYGPDERSDPMLRTISFVITERNVHCDVYNQHSNPLVPGQLCTGVAREMDVLTPCMAVPGAPLVVWGKLAGVLSWGLGCGYANDLPLIYSDVQYYGSWLTKTLKMLNNITQQDLNELFLATKSSKLSTWLSKTRMSKPLRQPISENQEMQSIEIDKDLSAFDAKLYDIRDFLYDRKFHVKKKKIYKRMKAAINATTPNVKLMNYFQLPALKFEPFLSNKAIYFNKEQEEKNDDDSD